MRCTFRLWVWPLTSYCDAWIDPYWQIINLVRYLWHSPAAAVRCHMWEELTLVPGSKIGPGCKFSCHWVNTYTHTRSHTSLAPSHSSRMVNKLLHQWKEAKINCSSSVNFFSSFLCFCDTVIPVTFHVHGQYTLNILLNITVHDIHYLHSTHPNNQNIAFSQFSKLIGGCQFDSGIRTGNHQHTKAWQECVVLR